MFTKIIAVILVMLLGLMASAQSEYEVKTIRVALSATVIPSEIKKDYLFELQNIDTIFQHNEMYRKYFNKQKQIVNKKYSAKGFAAKASDIELHSENVDTPLVNYSFMGNLYAASVPNDNTMAISKDSIIVSAINTNVIFYDAKTDSLWKTLSLKQFSWGLWGINYHQYDPKAIYDYQNDRFILVYLAGSHQDKSNIVVAFSTTNNPMDKWNLYALEGNPLNDDAWTDYPAISLSNEDLFITGNLLDKNGGSWQTSFMQSVIWQIEKQTGFDGDTLELSMYSGIKHNGIPVRNIHPVRGGDRFYGPEMYFMSERNFDIANDTFFLINTHNYISTGNPSLSINPLISDKKYGMPPDAKQKTISKRLATNDSRVLGAFYHNNYIQFVGNSVDTLTGHASFYHGIFNPNELSKKIHLNIFTDTLMEYGYPNISYCGKEESSQNSIITYNFSSSETYPGMGTFFYESEDKYSKPIVLKSGDSFINILSGLQRWGDYSASQPMYHNPGEVWASATFGRKIYAKRAYGTWIASLNSPADDPPPTIEPKEFSSKVFPNPASDSRITVSFTLIENEEISIQIIDINGRVIDKLYQAPATKGKNVMSVSTLPLSNGVYFIVIKNKDKILKTHKIAVMN